MSQHAQLAKTFLALLCAAAVLVPAAAVAKRDIVLYRFLGPPNDGDGPAGGLVMDAHGNLYGTTEFGGNGSKLNCGNAGCGTVFKLAPDGTESVLYAFAGGNDGAFPVAPLVFDSAGNLYGTTQRGGTGVIGLGTIFMVSSKGEERVLYTFRGRNAGYTPVAGLTIDSAGNLYGTTEDGGVYGWGTVFELAPGGKLVTLYAFMGGVDGGVPAFARLLRDSSGNLYGTTAAGGKDCDYTGAGCGVVYKVSPNGHETVLYSFLGTGNFDGATPTGGVIMDSNGTLYGTTASGGQQCYDDLQGCGTVYKLTANGKEAVIHSFMGGSDGNDPEFGLIMDASGALYGTTVSGGAQNKVCGCGTVFRIDRQGRETILHAFGYGLWHQPTDGRAPWSPVMMDAAGNLYGTTGTGGFPFPVGGTGTVFEIAQ